MRGNEHLNVRCQRPIGMSEYSVDTSEIRMSFPASHQTHEMALLEVFEASTRVMFGFVTQQYNVEFLRKLVDQFVDAPGVMLPIEPGLGRVPESSEFRDKGRFYSKISCQ